MAEQHGGYRKPANPAPTSGPGALSKRTDGGPADTQAMQRLPDAKYGEQKNFQAIQSGADLAGDPTPAPQAVSLGAESQRPDEPVTAGSPVGAGVGPTAAGIDMRTPDEQDAEHLRGFLPVMEFLANRPGASPSTRILVRRIKGNLT